MTKGTTKHVSQALAESMATSDTKPNCVKPEVRHSQKWLPDKCRSPGMVARGVQDIVRNVCLAAEPWPLFLWGDIGTGKTCVSLLMLDCYGGLYRRLVELSEDLRDADQGELWAGATKIPRRYVWRAWEDANLTVLDEIGRRQESDFRRETLQRAIDLREGKPAVFIGNLGLEALSDADVCGDRIASRLASGTVVHMAGTDRRIGRA